MSTFSITIEIGSPQGDRFEQIEALVDTGATTTVVPASVLRYMGVVPTRQETFEYGDGRQVQLDMAETIVRVEGKETTPWVIFGVDGSGSVLGAETLEGLHP